MDNTAKWWDTQAEAKTEALRKFGETEKQREAYERTRKVTTIMGALFVLALIALCKIVGGAH